MPPGQGENCPAHWGRQFAHTIGMSKVSRPEAYSEIAKRIGQRIRWARELVEPNRAEFARAMKVDRSTIRDIESGRRPPSIFNVLEIAHLLRVSPDYILIARMRDVDGELAGKLALKHPELVGAAPSGDIPRTAPPASTSRKPRKPNRRAAGD